MDLLKKITHPGLRIIKTAIAVFCTLLFYKLTNREGVSIAAVATIICLQDSINRSFKNGIYRLIGTGIGGVGGAILVSISILNKNYYIWLIATTLGLILLMHFCNVIKKQDCIIIASVVYLIIVIGAMERAPLDPILYSLNRILDTAIGAVIALLTNYFIFRPNEGVKKDDHINNEEIKTDDEVNNEEVKHNDVVINEAAKNNDDINNEEVKNNDGINSEEVKNSK